MKSKFVSHLSKTKEILKREQKGLDADGETRTRNPLIINRVL